MKKVDQRLRMDQPVIYRVEVQGQFDKRWSDWFDGMTVTVRSGEGIVSITTLVGTVADQAALQGMLRSLYNFGFPILSISHIESNSEAVPRDSAA